MNAERFITPELKQMENTILGADERSRQVEYEQFLLLREEVGRHIDDIQMTADAMADLDVLLGLAEGAQQYRYCRPVLDNSMTLRIVNGRHPVIEQNVSGDVFVPNDAFLEPEENRLILLTGPNMAGKSTYIRQVALITLMAQIGAYVPAEAAHIGLVDRIFCRVGASDDLARGQSTFMVEMSETSLILNNATERSLIILDEIGRGTATFDGLSIAWAVAEYLHDELKSRTLFATHYHELTDLGQFQAGRAELQCGRAGVEGGNRVSAQDCAGSGGQVLRHSGGPTGRHACRHCGPRQGHPVPSGDEMTLLYDALASLLIVRFLVKELNLSGQPLEVLGKAVRT